MLHCSDTCNICDQFKALGQENSLFALAHKFYHQLGRDNYARAKTVARQSNGTRVVIVFDFSAEIKTPQISSGSIFYKSPHCSRGFGLNVFPNWASADHHPDVQIDVWPEHEGGRGTNEVASCVVRKILELPFLVSKVTLASDNCPGQNRSQFNM